MTQRKHDWNASVQNYTHALYYDTIAHHTRLGTNPLQTARALTIFCLYPTLWYCQNLLWKPLKRNRLDLAPRKKEEDQQQNEPTNGPYKLESHYYNCIENCVDQIKQPSWISPFLVHAQCYV